jgi:hypothetical protein
MMEGIAAPANKRGNWDAHAIMRFLRLRVQTDYPMHNNPEARKIPHYPLYV